MLFYYGILAAVFWAGLAAALAFFRPRVGFLRDVAPEPGPETLALIIAIRNEEQDLPAALETLVRLQLPPGRILLINDRSTDRTGAILADFAQRYPQLQPLTITELPAGWLGKNHALYTGYKASGEEWLLFSDADILFTPDTVQKALSYCRRQRLDHLTLLPYVRSRSEVLNALLSTFATMLELRQRPWDIRNPGSSASLGVGAFNLVRRTAYERAGTHAALALRPDDDLQLGARIKRSGGRSDALYGRGQIALEWYDSVRAFIDGLMKNMFSVYNYRLWALLLGGVLPTLLFLALPLPLLWIFGGAREWILSGIILAGQVGAVGTGRGKYTRCWHGLLVPFAGALLAWVMLRAAALTLRQGGIYWRGHFYALAELRKGSGEKNR